VDRRPLSTHRPGTGLGGRPVTLPRPGGARPWLAGKERLVVFVVVGADTQKPPADPFRDANVYGVPDEPPSSGPASTELVPRSGSPACWKSLEALSIAYVRRYYAATRKDDSWGRRNSQRGASLQCRNCVDRPADSVVPLTPIETERFSPHLVLRWAGVLIEKNRPRIGVTRSEQKDSFSSLGKAKGTRIHHPVGPRIAESLKLLHQESKCPSLFHVEHEGHVLEQNPRDPRPSQQSKNLGHDAGFLTENACASSRLTQILAGEAGDQKLRGARKRRERADVPVDPSDLKAVRQDSARGWLVLAQKQWPMPCPGEPKFESADAGE
jgi:hypothetical protein